MNEEAPSFNASFCGEIRDGKHYLGVRVYYADTDFSGVVYHGRYLEFFERGRSEFLRSHDIHHHVMAQAAQDEASAWIVRRMALDFSAPARIDDILQVETAIAQIKPARIIMTQRIWHEARLLATAQVEVALVNARGRPRRIPTAFFEKINAGFSRKNATEQQSKATNRVN